MTFNIIKHRGRAMVAETLDGQRIERQEKLFVPEYGVFVPCSPDDDHFIYESQAQGSAYMCTCGSMAVIPETFPKMFVCHFYLTTGRHQTSVVNKDGFKEKFAGETLPIEEKKDWI